MQLNVLEHKSNSAKGFSALTRGILRRSAGHKARGGLEFKS